MKEVELFACYSVPLMKFLTEKRDCKYHIVGMHPTTHKKFWVFVKDEKVQKVLKEWKNKTTF